MHARHRSSSDGVRSSSAGMYNSDYRSFSRGGYGRGPPKAYPPAPPPPPPPPPSLPPRRAADIFMEAGRLAAEYLVSQGLLPSSSLPGNKWQNGHPQEFRVQDREYPPMPPEGRNSSFGRFGNVGPEGGSGRRRFPDEFNSNVPRSRMRGRKRNGHFKSYGSDWSRENGRGGPWAEQNRGFPDAMDGEDDFASGYYRDQRFSFDLGSGPSKAVASEQQSRDEMDYDSDELETYEFPSDSRSKQNSSSALKEPPQQTGVNSSKGPNNADSKSSPSGTPKESLHETDMNSKKEPADPLTVTPDTGEADNAKCGDEMVKETLQEKFDKEDSVENVLVRKQGTDDPVSKQGSDLLHLCNFTKVPTKTRSSLSSRALRADQASIGEEKSACEVPLATNKNPEEEDSIDVLKSDSLANPTGISRSLPPEVSIIPSVESVDEARKSETESDVDKEISPSPQLIRDSSFMDQEESSDAPPGFDTCRPVAAPDEDPPGLDTIRPVAVSNEDPPHFDTRRPVTGSNEDESSMQQERMKEGTKRPREWPSSVVLQDEECFRLHNPRAKQPFAPFERLPPDVVMVEAVDHETVDGPSSKGQIESGTEPTEEKQLPPSSFKICDLNLTDVSEAIENPHDLCQDHVSALKVEKESPVDVGLSINNNFKSTGSFDGSSNGPKEVTVIDVPDDPVIEDRVFSAAEQKTDPIYSSIESFLNHPEHTVDLPHVQDGYGQSISEFLGTDISSCSSVTNGITDLQAEMTLHSQEGILPDDDQLFLSLGEIPMSFLGVWDPPPQEYGKPF